VREESEWRACDLLLAFLSMVDFPMVSDECTLGTKGQKKS